MKLRQHLGLHGSYTARARNPRRCYQCHLTGHNSSTCQIDRRMRELTGDEYWTLETWPEELPMPSNVVPMRRRA